MQLGGGCSGEQPPREGSGAGGLSIARGEGEAGEEDESRLRDIFNIARLLGKCLGRAARAPGLGVCLQPPAAGAQLGGLERLGGVLGCSPGILGCEHGVVTLLPRIGEVAKEGTSVPMPWETTLGAIGGGRRGSWTSIFLCRGEAGGEKVA